MAFSPDGTLLCTGAEDGTAQIWEWKKQRPIGQPLVHLKDVRQVRFSTDGAALLTASHDGIAKLWQVLAGQSLVKSFDHPAPVLTAVFAPDGKSILTGCHNGDNGAAGAARLWRIDGSSAECTTLSQNGQVLGEAYSPDGMLAATAGNNRTVKLWDLKTGKMVLECPHPGVVKAVAFSREGRSLAFAGQGQVVQLWDLKQRRQLESWNSQTDAWVWSLSFSPDDRYLMTDGGPAARIWHVKSNGPRTKPVAELKHEGEVRVALFRPDGKAILTCSEDHTAKLWRLNEDRVYSIAEFHHAAPVLAGAFTNDARKIATASADGTVRVWDADNGSSLSPPLVHDSKVIAVTFSPDGESVVAGCDDGTARLWRVTSGAWWSAVLYHHGPVTAVAFHPTNNRLILTASTDGSARLWTMPDPVAGSADELERKFKFETGMEIHSENKAKAAGNNGPLFPIDPAQWRSLKHALQNASGSH